MYVHTQPTCPTLPHRLLKEKKQKLEVCARMHIHSVQVRIIDVNINVSHPVSLSEIKLSPTMFQTTEKGNIIFSFLPSAWFKEL